MANRGLFDSLFSVAAGALTRGQASVTNGRVGGVPGAFMSSPFGPSIQYDPGTGALTDLGIQICEGQGIDPAICRAGAEAVAAFFQEGGQPGATTTMQQTTPSNCPQGYVRRGEECVPVGQTDDMTPGVTTPAEGAGIPTRGRYGVGVIPFQVGEIRSSRGVNPIRRCPGGMVLGKDNVCYDRLRKSERKWPPGRKPLLTGGERNAITKAKHALRRVVSTKKDKNEIVRLLKRLP